MATPTLILLFASGLIVAVALAGYGLLVLIDLRSSHRASAVIEEPAVVAGAYSGIIHPDRIDLTVAISQPQAGGRTYRASQKD